MVDERTNGMRRVLEIFTESGWISESCLTQDSMTFKPTLQGLDDTPKLLKLLEAIALDETGETLYCAINVCKDTIRTDNYLENDDNG